MSVDGRLFFIGVDLFISAGRFGIDTRGKARETQETEILSES
jgi:hypothetical protein